MSCFERHIYVFTNSLELSFQPQKQPVSQKKNKLGNDFLNFYVPNPISIWKKKKKKERKILGTLHVHFSFPKTGPPHPTTHSCIASRSLKYCVQPHMCTLNHDVLEIFFFFNVVEQNCFFTARNEHILIVFIERIFAFFLPGNISKQNWILQ